MVISADECKNRINASANRKIADVDLENYVVLNNKVGKINLLPMQYSMDLNDRSVQTVRYCLLMIVNLANSELFYVNVGKQPLFIQILQVILLKINFTELKQENKTADC